MNFGVIDGVFTITLDLVATTAVAAILLMIGYWCIKHIKFFEKYCFPAPVIGGFAFALITWFLHSTGAASFKLDTTLQSPFMLAFFTTIGLGGSLALLKTGGRALIVYLVACWCLAVFQNTIGVVLAKGMGLHPLMGVMAGAVSMEGGHGAAAAFGPEAEAMGAAGAATVAIACATFGLIAGNMTGGPLARFIIDKKKVAIKTDDADMTDYAGMVAEQQAKETMNSKDFLFAATIILIMMALGIQVAAWVKGAKIPNFFLPGYVGAMFGAIILRNLNDSQKWFTMNSRVISVISDICLGMFLSLAMMSLKIWQLADLALPLLVILLAQVAFIAAMSYFVLFRLLGSNYDAAVMCAGFMGHGLGATPNAVANMGAVSEHYGLRSTKAFLIVPLCGAVLIDLVAIPCISLFMGYFGS